MTILEPMLEKLFEVQWYTWTLVVGLLLLGVIMIIAAKKVNWNSRNIVCAAMTIAISFVLSCIRIYRMPQGGSVTLMSMLPIVAYSVAFGPLQGVVVGCAYGMLDLLNNPYVIHPMQLLLDYPLAYAALGLGGIVVMLPINKAFKLPMAVIIGAIARLVVTVISGIVFFSEYADGSGHTPLIYSIIYNGSYLTVESLICIVATFIPGMYRIVETMNHKPQAA